MEVILKDPTLCAAHTAVLLSSFSQYELERQLMQADSRRIMAEEQLANMQKHMTHVSRMLACLLLECLCVSWQRGSLQICRNTCPCA